MALLPVQVMQGLLSQRLRGVLPVWIWPRLTSAEGPQGHGVGPNFGRTQRVGERPRPVPVRGKAQRQQSRSGGFAGSDAGAEEARADHGAEPSIECDVPEASCGIQ